MKKRIKTRIYATALSCLLASTSGTAAISRKALNDFNNSEVGKAFNTIYNNSNELIRGACFADGFIDQSWQNFSCPNSRDRGNDSNCRAISSLRTIADSRWGRNVHTYCNNTLNELRRIRRRDRSRSQNETFDRGRGSYQVGEDFALYPESSSNTASSRVNLAVAAAAAGFSVAGLSASQVLSTVTTTRYRFDKSLTNNTSTTISNCATFFGRTADEMLKLRDARDRVRTLLRTRVPDRTYANDGRDASRILPALNNTGSNGNNTYYEFDVLNNNVPGRGARRLVFSVVNRGGGRRAIQNLFYTNDHYRNFIRLAQDC